MGKLDSKLEHAESVIVQYHDFMEGNIHVSFSGGMDSTVLLHIVRSLYPHTPAVFTNTGLEYPEIVSFVRNTENVAIVSPNVSFRDVLTEEGYPFPSKRVSKMVRILREGKPNTINTRRLYATGIKANGDYAGMWKLPKKWEFLLRAPFLVSDRCCDLLKKGPLKEYAKLHGSSPMVGFTKSEGNSRNMSVVVSGCNTLKRGGLGVSRPLLTWTKQDILAYVDHYGVPYSSIYDTGISRTGCCFCGFGVHLEGSINRFHQMRETHPKMYDYCISKLGVGSILSYCGVGY